MVSHVRAKDNCSVFFLAGVFQKKKGGGSFFLGNSGGVGRTYLGGYGSYFQGAA
jgi:hypothetical protein